ncbi:hypothetical protein SLEP1_g7470 [Rubroshorea leprosula]|uniref:Uncharacterized protein n=1 Tax=Rubroshorea leprosula TaxID=152421 RepID=A0AAV5I7Q1_9ROSI|nr:hypothetical protein SLEP1_g7470 [Rubroshorea leprosula]
MSCSIAVSSSPVFSPSSTFFYNKTSILSPSAEALNLTLTHLKSTSSPFSPSPSSSPSSPFRIRIQKTSSGPLLSSSSPSSLGSGAGFGLGSVLKRKRPARLDIPVATAMAFTAPLMKSQGCREMESEGDGYSVYCKRGRREAMEDRFVETQLLGSRDQQG